MFTSASRWIGTVTDWNSMSRKEGEDDQMHHGEM